MSTSLRSIVQQVTREKLEELKQQRNLMNDHFNPVLKHIEEPSVDLADTLRILLQAVKNTPVKNIVNQNLIANLNNILRNVKENLTKEIRYSLKKCDYSYLYGSLLHEWFELEEKKEKKKENIKQDKDEVVRKVKSLLFTAPSSKEFEVEKFRKFLSDELLNFEENVEGHTIMKEIRRASKDFFKIGDCHVSSYDVQCCIEALIMKKLLCPEKIAALKELNENCKALDEIASLLTNHLRNLKNWKWSSSCEIIELCRGRDGEYRAFMNEDIVTALFLQFIGVQWTSYFKRQFMKIYESRIFAKVFCHSDSIEREIEAKKKELHQSTFLSSLPDSMESQDSPQQDELSKVNSVSVTDASLMSFIKRAAGILTRKAVCIPKLPEPDIDFKQAFLSTFSTEIRLHKVIRQDKPLVVVQAKLESFSSSVVHDAALIALEYFGVPQEWLNFFKEFLQPRVSLVENEKPQLVVRGVPTSHTLSSIFEETVLFLLDLLVNQKCNGMLIYRISDEFWFWGETTENVTKAWEMMNTFGKIVGLKIKQHRSGSVVIYSNEALTKLQAANSILCGPFPLPQRSIHWGYLELYSNGTFKIDRKAIKKFLNEMRVMLVKSECVLEWIDVFNKHMELFVRNFGKQHLDQINTALRILYFGLFGSENPVEKLKSQFAKLREADIVDEWVYLSLEKGGLGLVNPFIEIMRTHEEYYYINDDDYFTKLPLKDKELWETIIERNERKYGKIKDPRSFQTNSSNLPIVPDTNLLSKSSFRCISQNLQNLHFM